MTGMLRLLTMGSPDHEDPWCSQDSYSPASPRLHQPIPPHLASACLFPECPAVEATSLPEPSQCMSIFPLNILMAHHPPIFCHDQQGCLVSLRS